MDKDIQRKKSKGKKRIKARVVPLELAGVAGFQMFPLPTQGSSF
jgi:hypothetical protein